VAQVHVLWTLIPGKKEKKSTCICLFVLMVSKCYTLHHHYHLIVTTKPEAPSSNINMPPVESVWPIGSVKCPQNRSII